MDLKLLAGTEWTPEPLLVYKPRQNGQGVAMRVQLRLEPEWEVGENYVKPLVKGNGGLFMELAQQEGTGEGGFAKFGWGSDSLIRVKLGLPDVSKIIASIDRVRLAGQELPTSFRGKAGPDGVKDPFVLSLFHKFGDAGTAITMAFEDERSIIRISKSRDWAASIVLEIHEELQLRTYLALAMEGFLRVGVR